MRKLRLLLTASALWYQNTACAAPIEVLAVEFPPISTLSDKDAGLAFQLLRRRTINPDTEWAPLFLPPGRVSNMIAQGDWCATFYPVFDQSSRTVVRLSELPVRFGLLRKTETSRFSWNELDEFAGRSLAVLRDENSVPLFNTLKKSGISLVYVESIQNGAQMVLLDRVDMAIVDEFTYQSMERSNRSKVQFSERPLVQMHIELYVNVTCADEVIPLLRP